MTQEKITKKKKKTAANFGRLKREKRTICRVGPKWFAKTGYCRTGEDDRSHPGVGFREKSKTGVG